MTNPGEDWDLESGDRLGNGFIIKPVKISDGATASNETNGIIALAP